MKRYGSLIVLLCLFLTLLAGCAPAITPAPATDVKSANPPAANEPVKTLRLVTLQSQMLDTLNGFAKQFEKKMPGYTVEVTVVPGVAEFNAAMAAKLAAGDPPDLMIYQWGTQIQLWAKGGHLMDLTNTGLEQKLKEIKRPYHVYEGKIYGLPVDQTVFGVYFNVPVAKKYGVEEMPKSFPEFLAACETMRKNGLKEPIVIAGADGSGATAFNFGYLHTIVSAQNPDFYLQTVEGTKKWNGEEWRGLFDNYAQLLKYANEDRLGLDPDNARKRFAKGEAAFFMGGSWDISSMRKLNPDLEFILAPAPWVQDEEDLVAMSDFNDVISVSSKTKYPEAALAFLELMFTVENGNTFAKNLSAISPVKGTSAAFDKSLENQMPFLDSGKFVGFSEREWIPGIKEIMKKATQEWMAGVELETVMDRLEAEHQRLLTASPQFKQDFIESRKNMQR